MVNGQHTRFEDITTYILPVTGAIVGINLRALS